MDMNVGRFLSLDAILFVVLIEGSIRYIPRLSYVDRPP